VYGKLHVNAANRPVLSEASVTCGGQATTTGDDGSFSLSEIAADSQSRCFSKHGYQLLCATVPIVGGKNYGAGGNYLIITGDMNADGSVDIFDYGILYAIFGQTNCGNQAALDGNRVVDMLDYNLCVENYARTN
jgi:hypothetical protein